MIPRWNPHSLWHVSESEKRLSQASLAKLTRERHLELFLQVRKDLLHDRHILCDNLERVPYLALELSRRHLHECFKLRSVGLGAELQVGWPTCWAEVLVRKLLEVLVGAAAIIVFELCWIAILDGGVAPDTMRGAQFLPFGSAVSISDEGGGGALEVLHQFVPSGLQALAVASPRRLELDEDPFPSCLCIPIFMGKRLARSTYGKQRGQCQDLESHRCV